MHIEIDVNEQTYDYGMFTDLGNAAVHAVVEQARADKMTRRQTYRALEQLAKDKQFGEALDTMVREIVYCRIGADDRRENFYC
jgi:hypothetical protein